jgi:hypothetical protein
MTPKHFTANRTWWHCCTQKLHRPARVHVRSCSAPVGSTVRLDEAGQMGQTETDIVPDAEIYDASSHLILSPVISLGQIFFTALAAT